MEGKEYKMQKSTGELSENRFQLKARWYAGKKLEP